MLRYDAPTAATRAVCMMTGGAPKADALSYAVSWPAFLALTSSKLEMCFDLSSLPTPSADTKFLRMQKRSTRQPQKSQEGERLDDVLTTETVDDE